MKKIITASLVATLALTSVNASSVNDRITDLEAQLAKLKKKVTKQNKKINEVKAHDAGDNIKWGADVRTSIDHINYDMADGTETGKNDLMALRLWLNMAYAPDANNVFKGQLSMNKAFGAKFQEPALFNYFDWTNNESLGDNALKVRQAYWLYLGEKAFGLDMPWTFSLGRRPSTGGFLANLREDDPAQSPLGHVINVEFDGLSSKLDLSKITGIQGMSIKLCMGQGSTDSQPLVGTPTPNARTGGIDDIKLGGFIFEPYNDGQFITKATWYRGYDVPDANFAADGQTLEGFTQVGDQSGGAFSVMVDGLTEDGILSETKVFGSIAYSKTHPKGTGAIGPDMMGGTMEYPGMLGSIESKTGTSYWVGAQAPVLGGKLGVEFNHGSKYWRPFTYAEDTMAGSKIATRGDAWEVYYTYQITEALSAQARFTQMDYDYSGSNGFFGSTTGAPMKIDDIKMGAAMGDPQAQMLSAMSVEKATDARFYIRYRY